MAETKDLKSGGGAGRERVVLCGASSYHEKYYLNQAFSSLPEQIRRELQVMCVLFTEDVGGTLLLEFAPDGRLEFRVEAEEGGLPL